MARYTIPGCHPSGISEPQGQATWTGTWGCWNKLIQNNWIVVWRHRNRTTQKYNIYKISFKGTQLIQRIYRIMLGDEDIPTSTKRNKIMKGKTYIDKVLQTSIKNVNKNR